MSTNEKHVSQAEFARIVGYSRAHVTHLKNAGRLVLTSDGKVDVDASKARIAETSAMNRDDVSQRWANQRDTDNEVSGDPLTANRFQNARATKEFYAAELSRLEFERKCGKLLETFEVENAISEFVGFFRQQVENLPYRVAPELVGKDLDTIRAVLKQEMHGYLKELDDGLTARIAEVAEADE